MCFKARALLWFSASHHTLQVQSWFRAKPGLKTLFSTSFLGVGIKIAQGDEQKGRQQVKCISDIASSW